MYPLIALIISFIIGSLISIPFITSQYKPSDLMTIEEPSEETTSFSTALPPTLSQQGTITASGMVTMEQRDSTVASAIRESSLVYQGERFYTDSNSSALITFQDAATIFLEENADFSIVQTLPYSFVFLQRKGTSQIAKQSNIPVSMRIMDATLGIEQGSVSVTVDPQLQTADITVSSGSAMLGYNNLNYISQVLPIGEGETVIFDNEQKVATIIQ